MQSVVTVVTSSSMLVKRKSTLYQRQLLYFSLFHIQKPDSVTLHFNTKGHSVNDFEVVGLEKYVEKTVTTKKL